MFVIDKKVRCWASPALENYVTDPEIKVMLHTLLLPPLTEAQKQEQLAFYMSGKYEEERDKQEEDSGEEQVSDEELKQTPSYIEDRSERMDCFKALFTMLLTDVQKFAFYKMEPNYTQNEAMVIVVPPSGSILTRATKKLEPLVNTEEGKKMISIVLETNLKVLAKGLDPQIKDPIAHSIYGDTEEKKDTQSDKN